MNTSRIFWGSLFIALGLIFILINFSTLNLDWDNIWQFWPVIIILLGISLVVKHLTGTGDDYSFKEYRSEFSPSINNAALYLEGAAGNININSTTDNLIFVNTECTKTEFIKSGTENFAQLKLILKKTRIMLNRLDCSSKVDISLNQNPLWKLNMELGAVSARMDLSKYKIEDIRMDVGAANMDIKLGALSDHLVFKLNAGASQIDISVPEEVGCEITTDDALSKKNIIGFNQISSNHYVAEGYGDTHKKIKISIDSGVSSISIRRYQDQN